MDRILVIGEDRIPEKLTLGAGEKLSLVLVALPGTSEDVRMEIDLDGEGADLEMKGIYICGGDDTLNICVNVRHNSPGCVSDQIFRGLADGSSRASFDGLVYVAHGAAATKAHQENHSILLSPSARTESRPQLEIYADDVECSHGATTGFLDEDELFYMRSRGIAGSEARKLQILSFLSPVMRDLPDSVNGKILAAI